MAYENLPGIFSNLIDGNLSVSNTNENPLVVVIGTAAKGSNDFYKVASTSRAVTEFGRADGTLVRGMYEVITGGAENVALYRIGAVAASLSNIGGGITVETVEKDDNAGLSYKLFWDDTAGRLRVYRASDNELVYDNYPSYPSGAIDLGEVAVSGSSAAPGAGNIGSLSVPITLYAANGVSGAVYTAGNDGILLSLMEKYEELFRAYKLLENEDIDIVVPQNVYLDDANIQDMTTAQVATVNSGAPWAASSTYPEPESTYDVLGKCFAQEYDGEWYFWWDMDRDGIAEIYPSVGSSTASTDANGTALSSSDFHEVNFGYQLADFCYRQSQNHQEMHGVIGVRPPNSYSLKDVADWVGKEPTYTESGSNLIISSNGSGLLGNRWMAGRKGNAGTGLPGHVVNEIDGLAYGGFVGTDSGWMDGTQEKDRNDRLIDIGKYLDVVGGYAFLSNSTSSATYVASAAAVYAGFESTLPANSAPTNKILPGVRLPYRISISKLDSLAGYRYVMLQTKTKGVVISDAPSAARPDSDYTRRSTVNIVKECIDAVRAAAEPFLGEGLSGARFAALDTAIDRALSKLQKAGYIVRYDKLLSATASEKVLGKANLELVLVPAYELRQLTVYVALSAQ